MIKVEIIYLPIPPQPPFHVHIEMAEGSTVAMALHTSGIYRAYPEAETYTVGIFANKVPLSSLIKNGDRIEIYRPLLLDPKERRKQKARK